MEQDLECGLKSGLMHSDGNKEKTFINVTINRKVAHVPISRGQCNRGKLRGG